MSEQLSGFCKLNRPDGRLYYMRPAAIVSVFEMADDKLGLGLDGCEDLLSVQMTLREFADELRRAEGSANG